jgi:hypothetical protein
MKKIQSTHYQAYLLRLWREGDGDDWRAVLEDAHSDTRRGFASLEALFNYLQQVTGEAGSDKDVQDTTIILKGERK